MQTNPGRESIRTAGQEKPLAVTGRVTLRSLKPEHAKVSGYFNYDNGTGRIRGIYLQQNVQVAPIFEAWMKPFENLGMTQLSPRSSRVIRAERATPDGGARHRNCDWPRAPPPWLGTPPYRGTHRRS